MGKLKLSDFENVSIRALEPSSFEMATTTPPALYIFATAFPYLTPPRDTACIKWPRNTVIQSHP